jgi:hypothetical protein
MMIVARSCSLLQRALALLFILVQVSAAQTTVSVSPPAKSAIPGSVFTLQVTVDGVAGLHLYHVILHFDHTMLRLESVAPGAFFPGSFFIYSPATLPSDTARFLMVDDALIGTQTRSGSGTFFSVQFRALQEGVSTVSLMEVDLRDGTNQSITHTRVDGTVTGTYPSVVFVSPTYAPGSAGGHDYGFDAFSTVGSGVSAVAGAGTVHVLPGTYREQVYINKNLALLGAGAASTTIVPPVSLMSQPFLPSRQERPIIGVDSLGTGVVIDGMTVDGEGAGTVQQYMTGVQYFKASGVISNCTVKRIRATPFNGAQMYIPILVNHDYPRTFAHTVEIHHDSVYDFGKTGIVVNHPGSSGNVHNNVVTGQGATPLNAQNGIQVGFGATAAITGNVISGVSYTGTSAAASAMLFAAAAGTGTVWNNTVTNAQVGLYLSQDGTPGWSCSADIRGNVISASATGTGTSDYYGMIALSAGTALNGPVIAGRNLPPASAFRTEEMPVPPGSGSNPLAAMSVALAGNVFSSSTPASGTGAYLLAMNSSTQTVTGDSNTVSGWSVGVVTDKDPAAALASTWRHNAFSGNNYGMYDVSGSMQDAQRNWWGNPTGPRDVKTLPGTPDYNNPNGLGDSVGARIQYNPWFLDAAQTQLSYFPLTVNVTGNGTASRTPDTTAYLYFTDVVLQAFPALHHHFVGWSGDTVSTANPITLKMTAARTVQATFSVDQFPLAVTVVGGGSVERAPDQALYDYGAPVALTAVPAVGYSFVGWSGDTTTGANPITLHMTGPRAVTATFAVNMYSLVTTVEGNGAVSRNPDQASYAYGTGVGLKATPAVGWHFAGWTGDTTATADTLHLTITGPRTLTARFVVNTYTLNITVAGNGMVAKNPDSTSYTHGTRVGLKAHPDPGYYFVRWTGDTTSTVDTLSVLMTRNRSYTATFAINVFPVNVTIAGNGSIVRSPDLPGYPFGTTVTLTAVSGGSYSFLGWTGDTVANAASITFTVWGPANLTATFIGDKFVSIPPDSLLLKNPVNLRLLRPARPGRDLYPIWTNLLSEVVAQGGFQPLSTESDQAGGMVLGLSFIQGAGSHWRPVRDSARVHGWVRLSKWRFGRNDGTAYNAVQRSLTDRSGTHTGRPRGLDILTTSVTPHSRVLTGEYRSMPPKRHNNRLFAELVALKLNIAASQLGKTPPGFGELVFQQPGHPFHDFSITRISAQTDSLLTYWQGRAFVEYDSAESAIARINRAFTAPLDTASWSGPGQLIVNGVIRLGSVPFLRASDVPPVILQRTGSDRGDGEDFEDGNDGDEEGLPAVLVLQPNYPNPFNPSTTLSFVLRQPALVTVRIFDILGRPVGELAAAEEFDEGEHALEFVADGLASGVYFSRIEVQDLDEGGFSMVETGKMVLLK